MGYTKLFSSIVASTIWREDDKTRLVWITMLALKNERHIVEASVPGLADLARVKVEECQRALKKMEEPDEWSRNQEHEGRRIVKCEGGWRILNGEHYRRMMSADDKREYQREYHRKYRAKAKAKNGSGPTARERAYEAASDDERIRMEDQYAREMDRRELERNGKEEDNEQTS